MADYMAAHIEIGGKLARTKLTELLSLIHELSAEDYSRKPVGGINSIRRIFS